MKITKFGTIEEKDGDIILNGFAFELEGQGITPLKVAQCIIEILKEATEIEFNDSCTFTHEDGEVIPLAEWLDGVNNGTI